MADIKTKDSVQRFAPELDAHPNNKGSFLDILKYEFLRTPFLALVKIYIQAYIGKNKSVSTAISEFKDNHPHGFRFIFLLDSLLLLVYLSIVLLVVIRGLDIQLSDYI